MPDVTQHPIFEPDGTITVYKNVPLDKSYEHSVNYSTQAAFVTALSAYNHSTLTNQSYSRLTQNSVRVELAFSYLKDCNYMMISDANLYGGKVYFCFIDTVEYVNNVTCDIFFTIDVLQTYFHDFTMRENFVEREHCLLADDVVGKNIVPESLELGELICHWKSGKYYLRSQGVYTVILYTPNMVKETGGQFSSDREFVIYDNSIPIGVTTTSTLPSQQLVPLARNQFGGVVLALPIEMRVNNTTLLANDIVSVQTAINMIIATEGSIIDIFQINGEIYDDNFTSPVIPVSNSIRDFNCNEQNSFRKIERIRRSF